MPTRTHKCKLAGGGAGILSAILVIVQTKPIFELGQEFGRSNSYMKLGRNQVKNDKVREHTKEGTDGQAKNNRDPGAQITLNLLEAA